MGKNIRRGKFWSPYQKLVTFPRHEIFHPANFVFSLWNFFSIACEEEEIRNVLNLRCYGLRFRELSAYEAHIVRRTI